MGMQVLENHMEFLYCRCASMPDQRTGNNARHTKADVGMAAFAIFFVQCASFPRFQKSLEKRHSRSNLHTLFNLEGIPSDNHIRNLPDGAPADPFDKLFLSLMANTQQQGGPAKVQGFDGHSLIALNDTEYVQFEEINGPQCSTRRSRRR